MTDEPTPWWPIRVCSEPHLAEMPNVVNLLGGPDQLNDPIIGPVVTVCTERDWYLWEWTGTTPETLQPKPLYRIWVL